ncbi:MAG: NADH:flavin oxidoreductase [Armatimonadetes bacterium]|nr:NADH:flavin oxidoreductase [Armatimonadota bacterium]
MGRRRGRKPRSGCRGWVGDSGGPKAKLFHPALEGPQRTQRPFDQHCEQRYSEPVRAADELKLIHGPAIKNRIFLAPLTNCQSHEDGTISDDEYRFLVMRAEGGFGMTMTCASHVQAVGQGFPGQLGVFSDKHLPGLTHLAKGIKAFGSNASVQLHHAGRISPKELVGTPVAPSDDAESGARGMSEAEVEQLIEDFIAAAVRCEKAGFDGIEIHGAHGYILCQFLSPEYNRRTDRFGGSLENRYRPIDMICEGIRQRCSPDFQVGLRISVERYGVELMEAVEVARWVLADPRFDYLDLSLWDVDKEPKEEQYKGLLRSYFTSLPRSGVRLGAAGKIGSGAAIQSVLDDGFDFVSIGRGAILHHDFAKRVLADPTFEQRDLPVTEAYLASEGLGPPFIKYMRGRPGFVEG